MAAGRQWWQDRHDAIFLGHLAATGNVTAAAKAAGFTPKSAHNRRERVPGFAAGWDQALERAEVHLEGRVRAEILTRAPSLYDPAAEEAFEAADAEPFDPWLALWLLHYGDNKKSGRHRSPRTE